MHFYIASVYVCPTIIIAHKQQIFTVISSNQTNNISLSKGILFYLRMPHSKNAHG